ncbi:glycine--tRNA ligase subunit beta [Rickettsia endosymbiont of Cardiosporidium cionae]|uniref:glycine--tRNA ligase subunit beta n=1 Tax=Rickettsia endosymbiont of Cardiosporidium cionae TaxID=2777155 RepID=UPI001895790D|nr:glycine--tRNA ligase subunit beta [Rickettsia endosymbiont of Cardiosporidium cionae]KAF8818660.1 glycine--tRNA ligase subunit beta [Rickettsia endosymbiont of Cardiosporidium cionae]
MSQELLIELLSEEIPYALQQHACLSYYDIFAKYLIQHHICYKKINYYYGPRRIILHIVGVADYSTKVEINVKGPKVLHATPDIIKNFCNSNNITENDLYLSDTGNQKFYFYKRIIYPQLSENIFSNTIADTIGQYVWPKSMRWGGHTMYWVRPLKNILCIFNGKLLRFKYEHLSSSDFTYGHKIISPNVISGIKKFSEYKNYLSLHYVWIDQNERKSYIQSGLLDKSRELGFTLNQDCELLEEVVGLVEYPTVCVGKIDEKFLSMPEEILIASMRIKQKYFTMRDDKGALAPYFLFVANIRSDNYSCVIKGNENVLYARLQDAIYLYNRDISETIESRLVKLKDIVFHSKLGSIYDKVQRITKICEDIQYENSLQCSNINQDYITNAIKASRFCKHDLVSEIVKEFPCLQGVMGYHYAVFESIDLDIALTTRDHYKPQMLQDDIPGNSSAILALADKLDNLSSLIAAGEKATGSKDPYALRRQSLGVVRILLENQLDIDIIPIIKNILDRLGFGDSNAIIIFMQDKLKYYLQKQGYLKKNIDAILTRRIGYLNIVRIYNEVSLFTSFLTTDLGQYILNLYKRSENMIISLKKLGDFNTEFFLVHANSSKESLIIKKYFVSEYEHNFYNYLYEDNSIQILMLANNDYSLALNRIELLTPLLSDFLDNVTVNDADIYIKRNRVNMVMRAIDMFNSIANFKKL